MPNSLYSFVIVDDEPEIREGIRDTIPWEELGFRFAGACANGNEALELVERSPPDVVMTDINMPFMDGLALGERLAEAAPATKVLIISGYDDFEYARRALKLQVYDYIVKPVTPVEFKATLAKLKAALDEERAEKRDLELIRARLEESLPILRERFLNSLITGKAREGELEERISYFSLPLPRSAAAYQCLVLDFAHRKTGEAFDIDLLSERNYLEKNLEGGLAQILFQDAEDRLVILSWGGDADALYREGLKAAEQLRSRLFKAGMEDTVIGVGEAAGGLASLPESYADALRAVQVAVLRGKAGVTAFRELGGRIGAERERSPAWGKALASSLRVSNLVEAYGHIDRMVEYYRARSFDIADYHAALRLVLAAVLQAVEELEIPEDELFSQDADPFAELRRLKSLDEVRSYFAALAESVVAYTGARQENFAVTKVREALEYLETHYADPELSLQTLCKELFISTSYLSANLKKHHERTFVEELTDLRIRKAKELLRTTALKTYEVAERTGYRDAHYFSLSFRKLTGLTPTEYRSRHEGN